MRPNAVAVQPSSDFPRSPISAREPGLAGARPPALLRDPADGPAEWPSWLARLALVDFCSIDLIRTVASSSGAAITQGLARALLAGMAQAGLFIEPSMGGVFLLRREVRTRWLVELEQADGGVDAVRAQLAAAGWAPAPDGVGPTLARLALDSGDWAGAEAVWRWYPSGDLVADHRVCSGYAEAPSDLRATYPGLSVAFAVASTYDPQSGHLDLDRMVTALIRDGSTLHGGWQDQPTPEATVVAGTLALLAHAVMHGPGGAEPSERERQIYDTLTELIRDSSLAHEALTTRALTLFHAVVGMVLMLRGDWTRARQEAEYGLILNDGCALPGFLAAVVVGLSCVIAGDVQGRIAVEAFLAEHQRHHCPPSRWFDPVFDLMKADEAVRTLDRDAARHYLQRHAAQASHTQWLGAPALHAAILSNAAILWDDPEQALAQFDALVAQCPGAAAQSAWSRVLLQCRVQLLLALGASIPAERTVIRGASGEDGPLSPVVSGLLDLWSGRFSDALTAADDGIFESRVGLTDRAFLYAIKSAALLQAGASEELVGSAARAACVLCGQAGTLLPFAHLPSAIRSHLVSMHGRHHDDPHCVVAEAARRGGFDELNDASPVASQPLRLTRREEVLLPLLATAASIPEIADQQYVSVNTLRKQVVTLRQKFGAASRDDLVRKAHEAGLLNRTAKTVPPVGAVQRHDRPEWSVAPRITTG